MPIASTLKVLIVDDQNSVRQMTRITLEELGIKTIHEAEDGKAAFATATVQPIDLIISDFNMPEMDGLGLLRAVRGHAALRTLPFILRAHMSYSALGTFALCTFPFSLKLLWSPLVDSRFWHVFGRRKSWIVPSQVCLAAALLFASLLVDETIESVCCHGIRI